MKSFFLPALILLCIFSACTQVKQENSGEKTIPMTKDSHSFAQPDVAVVTHLSLKLSVDMDKHILSGSAHLEFKKSKEAEQLILDTHDLTITGVTENNDSTPLDFKLGNDIEYLGQALTISLKPTTNSVTVHYSTSPNAMALQWLTKEQTEGKTAAFLFTQSQAILARTWVPIQDSPGIRFTYDATITVPKNLLAVMSAENPQQKNAEGIYHFKMPHPIPAYLLALAVGDIVFKPLDNRSGVYAEPASIEKVAWEFADMPKMISTAESLYGPYAWERYDIIVLPPSFPFGGMENPMLTFATPTIIAGDRSLTTLVAHELAHSWSGNLVTNATWNDFWMNEGFTVYFETRIMEALYGKDFADMQSMLGFEDLKSTMEELGDTSADTQLKLKLDGRDPDDGMTDIAYEKGHFLLLLIEKTVGREKFDAFLKNYFSRHAFNSITTEEFLKEYHSDLTHNDTAIENQIRIEDWIYKPGLPSNCPVITSEKFNKVEAEVEKWKKGTPPSQLDTKNYSAYEWLRFLGKLPEKMSVEQMASLDAAYHFTESGNKEIQFAWLEHAIRNKYTTAYPALRNFLNHVGRRKFVKPLYDGMMKSPDGKKMAQDIFNESKQNYHSITRETIEEMFRN